MPSRAALLCFFGYGKLLSSFLPLPAQCYLHPWTSGLPWKRGCRPAAKLAAKGVPIGRSPCNGAVDPVWTARDSAALSWCGLALRASGVRLPCHPATTLHLSAVMTCWVWISINLLRPFLPPPSGDQQDRGDVVWGRLTIRLCSFNVLS